MFHLRFGLAGDPSGFHTPFEDLTEGIAHELVEGLVDPFVPMGWIDLSPQWWAQGEAADLCYQNNRNPHVWYQNQELAAYWSNRDQACVAGNNTLATLTLAAAFRNDGPSTFIPQSLKFQLDGRSGKLLGGNGGNAYTLSIQVVNGTSHGYQFPAPLLQTPAMQVEPIDDTQPVQGNEVINANVNRTVTYKTQYRVTLLAPLQANAQPASGFYDIGGLPVSTAASYTDQAGTQWLFFNSIGSAQG